MDQIQLICPDSMKFLDLTLLPPKESRLNPTVITLRENQPAQRIANLILEGEEDSRLQIVDQEAKKLFSISETNELRSLVAFDREERSFYSIPLISSRGGNHTVRVSRFSLRGPFSRVPKRGAVPFPCSFRPGT